MPSLNEPLASKVDVVEQMMSIRSKKLTKQQRRAVKELLIEQENIFSKGEYDIKRTPYVEYRIDKGAHRSIRRALRSHPFNYMDAIDKQVEAMKFVVLSNQQRARGRAMSCLYARKSTRLDSALTTDSSRESTYRRVIQYRS